MDTPLRIVLDTNTVLALWLFHDPRLTALKAFCEDGTVALHCREDALEELRRVLAYPQFGASPDSQATILAIYRNRVEIAPQLGDSAAALPECRDRDDQKFLEIARDAAATHLLTRDKLLLKLARHRLIRDRFAILTPERFLAALPQDNADLQ